MTTVTKKITSKGQVTIPKQIRNILNAEKNGQVTFEINGKNIKLKPATNSLKSSFGAIKPISKPENFKKLKKTALKDKLEK